MKDFTQKLLTAAVVAAVSLVALGASASGTEYVFRMPLKGLQASTPKVACQAGQNLNAMGGIEIPAGCTSLTFSLEGFGWTMTDYAVCDRVEGTYLIPAGNASGASAKGVIDEVTSSSDTVSLYLNGTLIAVSACEGSGVASKVENGAVLTQIVSEVSTGTNATVSYH